MGLILEDKQYTREEVLEIAEGHGRLKFNDGIREGYKHRKSSLDTIKNQKIMQEDINKIKIEQEGEKKDIEYIKLGIGEIKDTVKTFIEKADKKFAEQKTVDELKDNVKWSMRLAITSLVSFLASLVLMLAKYILSFIK